MKKLINDDASAYDRILYPGHAYPETHPDLLATIGTLLGMEPPPVRSCRVLEIGCGDGSNIIPMALSLPESEFLGVDLAASAIAKAQDVVDRILIKNVKVLAMDLLDVTAEIGKFDYIIAHGFYSWVPPLLQDKLLSVCKEQLSPNGIAFISYNTYPAGHFRRALRDIMLFSADELDALDRVGQAKSSVQCVIDSIEEPSTWKTALQEELSRASKRDDNVLYHDELSPIYDTVYFKDFVKSANDHNLQFLAEASVREVILPASPESVRTIHGMESADFINLQQYMDFVNSRGFRRSLLGRRDMSLQREPKWERLTNLCVASDLHESGREGKKMKFQKWHGTGFVETDHPMMIAAIRALARTWPKAQSFGELLQQVTAMTSSGADGQTHAALGEVVFALAANNLLTLRTHDPPLSNGSEDRPIASPLVRLQAGEGLPLTTLLHTEVHTSDEAARGLLQLLDGIRDRQALVTWLLKAGCRGNRETLSNQVNDYLEEFGRLALLSDST